MKTEEIHATLDKMLADPKSKNFLNHLVRSYIPVIKVTKVVEKPKVNFKCVITRTELVTVSDVLTGMETEEFKTNFFKDIHMMIDGPLKDDSAISKLIGDKKLGVTGKDTTTFMSYPAFQEFYNWVVAKALKGDKHINWLLGSIKHKEFIKRGENSKDPEVKKKVENHKKQEETPRATYTLGDLGVLQKLQEELKEKENQ